jgi:hypothetical protein
MFGKLFWKLDQVFDGISLTYLRREGGRKLTSVRLWFVFLILVPCATTCHNIMIRSGAERAFDWLYYPRDLSEEDRSQLFVASFVSFLILNEIVIMTFSLLLYDHNWFFFFLLQSLCFMVLLFNISYIRRWLGDNEGQRPDEQCLALVNGTGPFRPIYYFGRTILFLLYGELQKLFFGVSWFLIITLLYVLPIYLRVW